MIHCPGSRRIPWGFTAAYQIEAPRARTGGTSIWDPSARTPAGSATATPATSPATYYHDGPDVALLRPGPERLPLLDRLAARPSGRLRPDQRQGPGFYAAGRRLVARHRRGAHAVPLGIFRRLSRTAGVLLSRDTSDGSPILAAVPPLGDVSAADPLASRCALSHWYSFARTAPGRELMFGALPWPITIALNGGGARAACARRRRVMIRTTARLPRQRLGEYSPRALRRFPHRLS